MTTRWRSLSSSVGTKILIALTGLALLLYLVLHLVGNSLVFLGPGIFNGYSEKLISNPLIVPIELGLLAIFVIHVYKTVTMWWANRQARPVSYYKKESAGGTSRKSIASTTMIYTGVLTFIFVVLHVKMFKYGTYYQVPSRTERDLYRLEMETFRNPVWVAFYIFSLVLIGSHLWHGFGSALESLGADDPRYTPKLLLLGKALAVLIAGGFIIIPLWVYFVGGGP